MLRTILSILIFLVFPIAAFGTSEGAFSNLDSAAMKLHSARAFLANGPFDFSAADNNIRKALLDIQKATAQAGKGSVKLTGKKLTKFQTQASKAVTSLASARTAAQKQLSGKGISFIDKAILSLQAGMLTLRAITDTQCSGFFQVEAAPGVDDIYFTHTVATCPFIYDEVTASFVGGEIGSLSYGYANDGSASENSSSCSQNLTVAGVCSGIFGRPGGTVRIRVNLFITGGPPMSVYLTFKRNGTVVGEPSF